MEIDEDYYENEKKQKKLDDFADFPTREPFNWRAYNNSQTREKTIFLNLLKELCDLLEGDVYMGKGRKPMPAGHMIFCMCVKVYSQTSSRRIISDLELCKNKFFIDSVPHFNSLLNYFGCRNITKHLNYLLLLSSLPVAQIETKFAVDSTGFSERRFMDRWSSIRQKYSKHRQYKKAHCIFGVHTNIVPYAIITEGTEADSPRFNELLKRVADNFNAEEVAADLAYDARVNRQYAEDLGITPFIPFKKNVTGKNKRAPAMNNAYKYFMEKREEYMKKYHQRSNAESGIFMVKQRFWDSVMMKDPIGQKNEILCKFLCHNLCVLAQELYLSDIKIDFHSCAKSIVAQ